MDGSDRIEHRMGLRPVCTADEAMATAWRDRAGAWSTLGYRPSLDHASTDFAVIALPAQATMGFAGLHNLCEADHTAALGMLIIDTSAATPGSLVQVASLLAQVAFERLGLNRVELVITELEQRDLYACWGAGFEFEGRSKQAVYRDDAFRDVLRYGLVRQRWEGLKRARAARAAMA